MSSLGRQALTSLLRMSANPMMPAASSTTTVTAPITIHGTWRRVPAAGRLPRVTGLGPRLAVGRWPPRWPLPERCPWDEPPAPPDRLPLGRAPSRPPREGPEDDRPDPDPELDPLRRPDPPLAMGRSLRRAR
ncbi:hypothetical protein Acsp06_42520 [Actinomycetospora sp. NBRC 106375]|nr:hypothetical protein Acsp06_42520 [Actinomycetospora sp. NBRC 106375]